MKVADDGKTIQFYDLAKNPPVLQSIEKSRIASIKDNEQWKHPPASADLDEEQRIPGIDRESAERHVKRPKKDGECSEREELGHTERDFQREDVVIRSGC